MPILYVARMASEKWVFYVAASSSRPLALHVRPPTKPTVKTHLKKSVSFVLQFVVSERRLCRGYHRRRHPTRHERDVVE